VLLHALIERLPDVVAERRPAAASRWLDVNAADIGATERAEMATEVVRTLQNPAWAMLFGPKSLAEAPFSAVIEGGIVVAGTVDRLLVTDDAVFVVDYKTGSFVPGRADQVAPAYLRQMAAYSAALAVIFPGRRINAALLYTAAPRLIALPLELLVQHKPGLADAKANLLPSALEQDAPNA
jgi:ATP-dependent helicase/nuclease subunit A